MPLDSSEVYYVNAHVPIEYIPQVPAEKWYTYSLIYQTKELAGKVLSDIVSPGDSVAVKIHFGGKVAFVNLAMDIVPLCDCDPFQGVPVVPDLGVLASKDPVAVDRACVDLVNASHGILGSMAEAAGVLEPGVEKINAIAKMRWKATPGATHVTPDWRVMLKAAERVGLGTQRYKLVKVNFGFPPQKN